MPCHTMSATYDIPCPEPINSGKFAATTTNLTPWVNYSSKKSTTGSGSQESVAIPISGLLRSASAFAGRQNSGRIESFVMLF
jgi:hypothetical protein